MVALESGVQLMSWRVCVDVSWGEVVRESGIQLMSWCVCVDVSWGEVERESGIQLMHLHGSLDVARKGTDGIDKLRNCEQAMKRQNVP